MKERETSLPVTTPSKMEAEQNGSLAESPFFVEAEKMFERLAEISRETAQKAHDFFLARGGEFGKEIDDWFNAENEVLQFVPVEVAESNGTVRVKAHTAGFKPEDIEICVKDDMLMISGLTEQWKEKEDKNVVYSDFKSNKFFRRLTLPVPVNADDAKAEMKDGILNIILPKADAVAEPKLIAVKAAG